MFLAWQITIFLSPVIRVNCWWFGIYYLTCFFRIGPKNSSSPLKKGITLKVSTCHFLPQDPQRLPLSFSHCDQLADVWSRIFWLCDRCNEKLSNNDITWWTYVFNPWCFQNKHTETVGYSDTQTCPMRLCNFENESYPYVFGSLKNHCEVRLEKLNPGWITAKSAVKFYLPNHSDFTQLEKLNPGWITAKSAVKFYLPNHSDFTQLETESGVNYCKISG